MQAVNTNKLQLNNQVHREIVRYANRKLYDKLKHGYITLNEIGSYIKLGDTISVIDYKTKDDVTKQVLIAILSKELETSTISTASLHKRIEQLTLSV